MELFGDQKRSIRRDRAQRKFDQMIAGVMRQEQNKSGQPRTEAKNPPTTVHKVCADHVPGADRLSVRENKHRAEADRPAVASLNKLSASTSKRKRQCTPKFVEMWR